MAKCKYCGSEIVVLKTVPKSGDLMLCPICDKALSMPALQTPEGATRG